MSLTNKIVSGMTSLVVGGAFVFGVAGNSYGQESDSSKYKTLGTYRIELRAIPTVEEIQSAMRIIYSDKNFSVSQVLDMADKNNNGVVTESEAISLEFSLISNLNPTLKVQVEKMLDKKYLKDGKVSQK